MAWRAAASLGFVALMLTACAPESPTVSASADALWSGTPFAGLETPYASFPAAGICDQQPGSVATFTLENDVPSPRCGRVLADQRLRVVNATSTTVIVTFHGTQYRFDPGAVLTFTTTFGSIWEPGVHVLSTSMYGGGGPEIWLGAE
jgi:hypothetical protein